MPLRRVKFPQDWAQFGQVIADSFQYPENDEWGVQADERDQFIGMSRNLRRLWPLIRIFQLLSPSLKDIIDGVVWEKDSRLVGTTFIQRLGQTSTWYVMGVGVLPEFRRQGMARQLMRGAIDLILERGGEQVILNVIEGNLPAIRLYESLGMEIYDGSYEFALEGNPEVAIPRLPDGYRLKDLNVQAWGSLYELAERITPPSVAEYEAIEADRFKPPSFSRVLGPIVMWAQGMRRQGYQIELMDGTLVSSVSMLAPTRGQSSARVRARLDPEHGALAGYIVAKCQNDLAQARPGCKIESSVPRWMESMVQAHRAAGFETRYAYLSMGMKVPQQGIRDRG
jgi:ribosomal protein S18 acetylase RimI-like enzyme